MNPSETTTLLVSILAVVAGVVMALRVLQRQKQVPPEAKLRQLRVFTRRRLLISALLVVVGVMLYLGDFVLVDWFKANPKSFGWFWLAVVVLLVWLLVLALADIYAVVVAQIAEHYKRKT